MGWLDKAKVMLGILDEEDVEEEGEPRAEKRIDPRRDGRPSLEGIQAPPQQTLDDVLALREAGDHVEMRRLLAEIDRGGGLRTVLRAAAALEAGDERELEELLPRVAREEPAWKLPLQVATALDAESERGAALVAQAEASGAPAWALAWARALSADPKERRRGLVELLFASPALARTVAARDLKLPGAQDDPAATKRYVSFAHGRECIRRFGAGIVADLLARVARA